MSLESTAQELFVLDPAMGPPMADDDGMQIIPLQVEEAPHEHHEHEHEMMMEPLEVHDKPMELEIVMELPGAPPGTKDPEPVLEVAEEPLQVEDKAQAEDEDPAKAAKEEKWNWSKRGPTGFIAWVKERCDDVPKHSGYDTAGLERAIAYLERLDSEVSKAMRNDTDGELDANQIEKVRSIIDNGIERLQDRLDKVKQSKKKPKKTKKSDAEMEGLVKEAQKITGVQGIYIVAPLLASRIARVCINGMVSAGHDIEDLYARQVKKYKLNEREQAEVMQLLSDMGYPLPQDRGFMPDEDYDRASSDNMDWAANYNPSANVWGKDR